MDESLSPQPDVDLSDEERRRMFQERYAQALSNIRANAGPLSVAAVPFPTGPQAQLSVQAPFVTPFVNVDPFNQEPVQSYGARAGNMGPAGGYELAYTYDPQTKVPVVSGAYRKQLDKDSEITAQGSYVPLPGRDAYQAMMQYKQRFADGGEVFAEGEAPYEQELTDYIKQELSSFRNIPPNVLETMAAEREETRTPAYRKPSELSAYMSAVVPGLKVQREKLPIGLLGEVSSAIPDTMKVRNTLTGGLSEATQLHELEHVLKNRAVQGAPKDEKIDNDVRFDRLYGDESGKTRREMVDTFIKNKGKIEKFFGRRLDDYFNAETKKGAGRNFGAMFEEQIATISALEQITGKSITKGMPDLFPNDKAAAVYDAITGLRQTRLDAKDLPPYTPQYKSGMDWIKDKLRMRADGSPPEGEVVHRADGSTEKGETSSAPELKASPQDPLLGFIAKALKGREEAQEGVSSGVGALLDLLLPSSKTVEKWSYGDPLFRMPPSGTGGYVPITTKDKGYVAETISYAPIAGPAKAAAGVGVTPPLGVIRPKGGGNLLSGEAKRTIEPLRPKTVGGQEPAIALKELGERAKELELDDPLLRPEAAQRFARRIKESRETLKTMAALDDWIQNKLGGYIKKQMGTEDDPIRKLADEMTEKAQADYQAGLKRIAKMKDDIAKAKARGKKTDVSEAELADEIDSVEEAFKNASILPAQIGPYTHVSSRLGEAREKAGFSPFPTAKSREGKAYEELADIPFVPMTKKELVDFDWFTAGPGYKEANQEWVSKLKDEDIVYRIRSEDLNEREVFVHTIDELRNALNPNSGLPQNLLLKPEDMQSLGIEKAFRHVNNINNWRMQQRIAANLEEAKRSAVTIKEYPGSPRKLKWQQLKPMEYTELPPGYTINSTYEGPTLFGPDGKKLTTFNMDYPSSVQNQALQFLSKNDLEKALKYEGSTMRHCVGGYCDSVWSNETQIFSLRDKKGEPHVTIETAPADIRRDGNTPRDFIFQNPEVGVRLGVWPKNESRWPEDVDTFLDDIQNIRRVIATPEFQEWLRSKPAEILQIKGKGNAKPKDEYIPFVQDFVKSQHWSNIDDLQNADLVPLRTEMFNSLTKKGIDVDVFYLDQASRPFVTKQEFNRLADVVGGVNKYD